MQISTTSALNNSQQLMNGGGGSTDSNLYRVGDHVYFELVAGAPFQIRKIEELMRNSNGSVVARVSIYFRRRDISANLLQSLEKEHAFMESSSRSPSPPSISSSTSSNQQAENNRLLAQLTSAQQEHIKLCEVFPSSRQEVLQANHIRGKCQIVSLQDEIESRLDFLNAENTFYFSRKYDPEKKTLKPVGEKIRVGIKWQAEIPDCEAVESSNAWEVLQFQADRLHPQLVEDFTVLAAAVGLLARGTQLAESSLRMDPQTAAATAHRSVTKEHAMQLLHCCDYDLQRALDKLVDRPMLCKDELEDWSPMEAGHFTQLVERQGKMLAEIRRSHFPNKLMADLVSFYYFWKTTDRFVQQRQKQHVQNRHADSKLKQIYIPGYNRLSSAIMWKMEDRNRGCDSCQISSSMDWFCLELTEEDGSNVAASVCIGTANSALSLQCGAALAASALKLCRSCWNYWKLYGGLKGGIEQFFERQHSIAIDVVQSDPPTSSVAGPTQTCNSFACVIGACRLVFKTKSTLDRHVELFHNEKPTRSNELPSSNNGLSRTNGAVISAPPASAVTTFSLYMYPFDRMLRQLLLSRMEFQQRRDLHRLSRRPFSAQLCSLTAVDIHNCRQFVSRDPEVVTDPVVAGGVVADPVVAGGVVAEDVVTAEVIKNEVEIISTAQLESSSTMEIVPEAEKSTVEAPEDEWDEPATKKRMLSK